MMTNCGCNVLPVGVSSNTSPYSHWTESKPLVNIIGNITLLFVSFPNVPIRILFIIWDNIVRAYSAQTGEWIRDLEGANGEIINLQVDLHNPKIVIACTERGNIVSWKWKSGVVHENSVSCICRQSLTIHITAIFRLEFEIR